MKKGFTFIEVMVAISITLIGIVGVLTAIQQIFISTQIASSQLVAAYLCQEGIEIVRNIRDGNWLEGASWNDGITTNCGGSTCDWEADYQTQSLNDDYIGSLLRVDEGWLYNYQFGTSTPFARKITIASTTVDRIDVTVSVSWQAMGKNYNASTTEYLYRWWK